MSSPEKAQEGLFRSDGQLRLEAVPLRQIARTVGTPCYVYARAGIERRWRMLDQAFNGRPHLICYAVKACSNIAVLNVLAKLGSGFDVVSAGELARVIRAGGGASKAVFSGVGKRSEEIRYALSGGIHCFNVESPDELALLEELARAAGRPAPIAPRVNFDIHVDTHTYLSTSRGTDKFGVSPERAREMCMYAKDNPWLNPIGVACHIGSQLSELSSFAKAAHALSDFAARLAKEGVALSHIDVGGGLGIDYPGGKPAPAPYDYVSCLLKATQGCSARVVIEPGRSIIGPAGLLLCRVIRLKSAGDRHFAVVDAAMNDLLRPALYQAEHAVCPVRANPSPNRQEHEYDVVGPVCESADVLARRQKLSLLPGDLVAILAAGAYGFSMASQYNSRPRPAEALVDGDCFHVIRRRESIEDLMDHESIPPPGAATSDPG